MISNEKITEIIREKVEADGFYIVDVVVKSGNRIQVEIDSEQGVPIEYCVSLSRLIEQSLDRESEDFELEVSSPGIGQPLKILRQYLKIIGKEIEVLTTDGRKISGVLSQADENGFRLKEEKMVKPEGKKRKELQVIDHDFNFEDVKSVKEVIKFK
ncbi:ribosome assembly cofactor RimP [Natronoflexus pectinivorans]|uniref:Ribosome maturation factor RimP n=1 Tax=Natronoflexus pectinivorans TaxID=682526 RepID=A0A4R2GIF9_9BACT|nr:ribosome assembly cofactor RimP [Natronoflexus pectinivorans]TCO07990.1 ribosome maturation factor RimP [Natronoflexus pectinivorans]